MTKIAKKEEKVTVTFEEAVSMTGYGKFHIIILIVTGSAIMSAIIETMCMMFIIPAAQCDLGLSLSEKGLLSSVSFCGVVSSCFFWGYISDTRGRKNCLVVSLGVAGIITLVGSVVPWDWLFILLRFINGFFIGAASSVIYAYSGEFYDNYHRPKTIAWMSTFVAFGNMYLPGMAWAILPAEWSLEVSFLSLNFKSWRLLLFVYGLPSIVVAIILHYLPESPKYLMAQGRKNEALKVLSEMYATNFRASPEDYKVKDILWDEIVETDKNVGMLKSLWQQIAPIFKGQYLCRTLMLCVMQFGIFVSTSGLVMWYPEILNLMAEYVIEHPNADVYLCDAVMSNKPLLQEFNITEASLCRDTVNTDVFFVMVLLGVAYAFTYTLIGLLINALGKKNLMIGFIFIVTICGLAAQLASGYTTIQILTGFFILGGANVGVINAMAVDLFPTQYRAMAFAVSLSCGRFGAVAATNIIGPIFYNFCDYLFYLITADHIVVIIVAALLPLNKTFPKLQT